MGYLMTKSKDKVLTEGATTSSVIAEVKGSSVLDMGNMHSLDMANLNEEQRQALAVKLNEAKIDLATAAQKAQLDLQTTKNKMDLHTEMGRTASIDGTAYTGTDSYDSSIGRIEMVIGNTERAAKGKMSRSGAGQDDISMKAIIVVGIVIVVLALIFAN